ncbi:MAG: HAMP domain-containing histidine kinase [Gammaproteobacteria bacterium]|nr:HAMP domain-containing histidine kinase [Gammaproteobacteria bacterium]
MRHSDSAMHAITAPSTSRSRLRMRTSITLLSAMLLAMLALAGFTFQLLKNQRHLLEQTLRESQSQTVALLASRIEQALIGAMRPPFLGLKNIPIDRVEANRLQQIAKTYPEVREIILLGNDMRIRHSFPLATTPEQIALTHWMADRAALEHTKTKDSNALWRVFAEQIDGQLAIFAIQRVNELDHDEGWILMHFDASVMFARYIDPMLQEFNHKQPGTITLAGPDSPWDDDALNWPVNRALPGWTLVFKANPALQAENLRRDQTLVLMITTAVIITLMITTFAVWRELMREHALVNLRNRFIANVSHELKTPLALIRMFAETLYLRRLADPDKQHEYHRTILRESERLSDMIDNVLNFSRQTRQTPLYQLNDIDLATTVGGVIADYRYRLDDMGLALHINCDNSLPAVAHDRGGIRQILLNLLDNAIKFGQQGGRIEIGLHTKDDTVELSVSDYGPGIPVSERDRLRQPFERGHSLPPDSGSGLGLAVVDQIAQAHNANFLLEHAAGNQGLRATVIFPVKQPTSP